MTYTFELADRQPTQERIASSLRPTEVLTKYIKKHMRAVPEHVAVSVLPGHGFVLAMLLEGYLKGTTE